MSSTRGEAALAAELAALTGLTLARPILDGFGHSPETLIGRRSDALDVIAFGLAIALGPLVLLAAGGVLARRKDAAVGELVHHLTLGALAAVGVMQILHLTTGLSLLPSVLPGLVGGAAVVVARRRADVFRAFLRYAGIAPVVFLVEFLALSPASSLVFGGRGGGADAAATSALRESLGDDAPPVVVVVLDALPTGTLLDGKGGIDAAAFPNFAALADDSTWYRNHTTVAPNTLRAVPAILSGRLLDGEEAPVASNYPDNLFTLLGGVYDINAKEQLTALCPRSLCPEATGHELVPLVNDAGGYWLRSLASDHAVELVPGVFDDRYREFEEWIDDQDFRQGATPDLFAYHLVMPHAGWYYLPDGKEYAASWPPHGLVGVRWGPIGAEVGRQRHVLQTQAVDTLLGQLFDRLREAGTYDDALIVVTADHGVAFEADEPWRAISEQQYEQIMWTPLLVKAPGQTDPVVDDSNVQSIDVLPAIADHLGIDLASDVGWDVPGVAPGSGPPRDPEDKPILDWKYHDVHAGEGERMAQVDGVEGLERVLASDYVDGTGPDGAWQFTPYHGLGGTPLADVEIGDPADVELASPDLEVFADVDLDADRPRIELRAVGWVQAGAAVAVATDGRIAAVVPARPTPFGVSLVHALVPPDALVEGDNDLALYVVDGPPESPTLHPLDLVAEE